MGMKTNPSLKNDMDFFRDVEKSAKATTASQRLAAQLAFAAMRYKETRTEEDDRRVLTTGGTAGLVGMMGLGYAAMPDDLLAETCRVCAEPYAE